MNDKNNTAIMKEVNKVSQNDMVNFVSNDQLDDKNGIKKELLLILSEKVDNIKNGWE